MIKYHNEFNIQPNDLVLDIGGGCNPFERANVVADLYMGKWRNRDILVKRGYLIHEGRQFRFVRSNVEELPFKDKQFDFVYCAHVLEHTIHPDKACMEIIRVGKRGYITTPDITNESILGDETHKWFVHYLGDNTLLIFPKLDQHNQYKMLRGNYTNYFHHMYHNNIHNFVDMYHQKHMGQFWYVQMKWNSKFKYIVITKTHNVKIYN